MSKLFYSSVHKKNLFAYLAGKRHIINSGGTSSSKTWSVMQLLTDIAQNACQPLLISVVSESMPHLKLGAFRDFKKILGDAYDEEKLNKSDFVYDFGKAQMEFFSADNPGKVHGPRRDVLFMNEVINIQKPICDALVVRTSGTVFYDFNPCHEFWVHEKRGENNVEWIHSTYLDAKQYLPQAIIDEIESRKDKDPNWWNIYGLGQIGNITDLVYPYFIADIEELPRPEKGYLHRYGLDFGYANSMTALTENIIIGDQLYSDEIVYQRGLKNDQLSALMEERGVKKIALITADSEDPRSIDELKDFGWWINGVKKGPDSVIQGIQKVNQFVQHWTKRSVNAIKEQRNHRYIIDKTGKTTNDPSKIFNHAMDSRRYAVASITKKIPLIIT